METGGTTGWIMTERSTAMNKYDDIINLPHHVSERHPQLGRDSYAAQFSPFAALTGYDGIVEEIARVTDERIELDDDSKDRISYKLGIVLDHLDDKPEVTVTYFLPDKKKDGGKYVTATGIITAFDRYERIIQLSDGPRIPVDDLLDIQGKIISRYLPEEV